MSASSATEKRANSYFGFYPRSNGHGDHVQSQIFRFTEIMPVSIITSLNNLLLEEPVAISWLKVTEGHDICSSIQGKSVLNLFSNISPMHIHDTDAIKKVNKELLQSNVKSVTAIADMATSWVKSQSDFDAEEFATRLAALEFSEADLIELQGDPRHIMKRLSFKMYPAEVQRKVASDVLDCGFERGKPTDNEPTTMDVYSLIGICLTGLSHLQNCRNPSVRQLGHHATTHLMSFLAKQSRLQWEQQQQELHSNVKQVRIDIKFQHQVYSVFADADLTEVPLVILNRLQDLFQVNILENFRTTERNQRLYIQPVIMFQKRRIVSTMKELCLSCFGSDKELYRICQRNGVCELTLMMTNSGKNIEQVAQEICSYFDCGITPHVRPGGLLPYITNWPPCFFEYQYELDPIPIADDVKQQEFSSMDVDQPGEASQSSYQSFQNNLSRSVRDGSCHPRVYQDKYGSEFETLLRMQNEIDDEDHQMSECGGTNGNGQGGSSVVNAQAPGAGGRSRGDRQSSGHHNTSFQRDVNANGAHFSHGSLFNFGSQHISGNSS